IPPFHHSTITPLRHYAITPSSINKIKYNVQNKSFYKTLEMINICYCWRRNPLFRNSTFPQQRRMRSDDDVWKPMSGNARWRYRRKYVCHELVAEGAEARHPEPA
ncbi:MAG: hypothetical protein KDI15_01030, partial [Thiothrix sp.]|nr:hypothetical protein [Thiothrix sp.]